MKQQYCQGSSHFGNLHYRWACLRLEALSPAPTLQPIWSIEVGAFATPIATETQLFVVERGSEGQPSNL